MAKENLNSKRIIKKIEEKSKDIRKFSVRKIGIFGSFSKNKQNKKSDIDIIVEFDNPTLDNYMELKFLLEKIFKRKIDIVTLKGLKPELEYVKEEAEYARL